MGRKATGARNFTNCDSLLIGNKCGAHTVPYIESKNSSAVVEHEATRRRSPTTSCSTACSAASIPKRRSP